MKAWLSYLPDGPQGLKLEDGPVPSPAPGEVLIAVRACGLNFPDLLMLRDLYQFRAPRPFAPGAEVAGTVLAVGSNVAGFSPGDRVAGLCATGGLAQRAVVPADDLFVLPPQISFETAAGLLFTYGTAHYALTRRGGLRAQDKVLVLGAGGGVGLASVELASALGAAVTAAASDPRKLILAQAKGAASTLLYPRDLSGDAPKLLGLGFKEAAGQGGYDIVVDPVGGAYCEPALRSIAWAGRYLVIGFPAGIPRPPLNLALLKGCDIIGVEWYQFGKRCPALRAAEIGSLMAMVIEGKITPAPSEVIAFSDVPGALLRMESRASIGKLVVSIPE